MMEFLSDDFLLATDFSKVLFHGYAKDLPIIDYHCHLSPKDIAENRSFKTLTEAWLEGDHYKWRAMRTLGIEEKYITGDGNDYAKFEKWAYAIPYTVRNPLYHWTHLELRRYFGITDLLSTENAKNVYARANELLAQSTHSTHGLLKQMKVEMVGTTDDPTDTLEHHQKIKESELLISVLPTFRPDKAYAIEHVENYLDYLEKLGQVTNQRISTFDDLLMALDNRVRYFHAHGCRLADHGLEHLYYPASTESFHIEQLFSRILKKDKLSSVESSFFKYRLLLELSRLYHRHGWTQQFHLGAIRNNNDRMMRLLGADSGFDSIGDFAQAKSTAQYLNELDRTNQLTKTIIYNLNPSANEVVHRCWETSMTGV
jgi:glucuronate isomerase